MAGSYGGRPLGSSSLKGENQALYGLQGDDGGHSASVRAV